MEISNYKQERAEKQRKTIEAREKERINRNIDEKPLYSNEISEKEEEEGDGRVIIGSSSEQGGYGRTEEYAREEETAREEEDEERERIEKEERFEKKRIIEDISDKVRELLSQKELAKSNIEELKKDEDWQSNYGSLNLINYNKEALNNINESLNKLRNESYEGYQKGVEEFNRSN